MTERERDCVLAYLTHLAGLLRLAHYRFTIDDRPSDDANCASISVIDDKYHATVWLNHKWRTYTPEQQREHLLHELLHIHTNGVDAVARNTALKETLGMPAWKQFYAAHDRAEERCVDALAQVITPFLPLPVPVTVTVTITGAPPTEASS